MSFVGGLKSLLAAAELVDIPGLEARAIAARLGTYCVLVGFVDIQYSIDCVATGAAWMYICTSYSIIVLTYGM